MARHKHADVIHAWADGAEIQQFCGDGWYDDSDTPNWFEDAEYRIKPRTVKHEGAFGAFLVNGLNANICAECVNKMRQTLNPEPDEAA
jgi:hypothetical protein